LLAVEGHLGPVARDPAQLGELVDRVMQVFERRRRCDLEGRDRP
jgi:hypothetical protein